MTTDDDTRLLDQLRDLWWQADPPPPGLTTTMIAAVAAAEIDHEWELLVLFRDSANEPAAQVRGLTTARMLYFTAAEGWSLDAEIDGDQVRGQLLDFDGDLGSVEVTVETADGRTWATGVDEVGFFAVQAEPASSIRFTIRHGEARSSSRWVEL
jgi:hypothetical protein